MTHASLFSGIGGAELAASWLGWTNLFHCEINPFGRKVLECHFPNSISYEDVTKTDFSEWRGQVDVLTAGFPCQPFSVAGQRKGADDDRYLWPEVVRVIREVRPAWVVGENVAGILTMVQPGEEVTVGSQASLFGEDDRKRVLLRQEYVIETICRDLERERYFVQPVVIPACAVGAPHRRDRVWFIAHCTDARAETVQCARQDGIHAVGTVAYTDCNGSKTRKACERVKKSRGKYYSQPKKWRNEAQRTHGLFGLYGTATNPPCSGKDKIHNKRHSNGERAHSDGGEWYVTDPHCKGFQGSRPPAQPSKSFADFPTQSPVCSRNDGFSTRLDGITFPRWRQESIKAYGNAWVPQVAYEIFKAIEESNKII